MAIWNSTYIHGILDTDDGYYLTPYYHNVASFDNTSSSLLFGDSNIGTKITGNGIIIDGTIEDELIVNDTIAAKKYDIIAGGIHAGLVSFSNDNISNGNCITIGDSSNINTIILQGGSGSENGKVIINGKDGITGNGNLYVNGNLACQYGAVIHSIATLSSATNTINLGDSREGKTTKIIGNNIDLIAQIIDGSSSNNHTYGNITTSGTFVLGGDCKVLPDGSSSSINAITYGSNTLAFGDTDKNTKINGNSVLFNDTCYGTQDPPTNAKEGQIYFKIIS